MTTRKTVTKHTKGKIAVHQQKTDQRPKTTKEYTTPEYQEKIRKAKTLEDLIKAHEHSKYMFMSLMNESDKLYRMLRIAMHTYSYTDKDLFFHGITFRAESINHAFMTLTKEDNYLAAMPLVRMQIDNFLTVVASLLVSDFNKFYKAYTNGKATNRLKDKEGNLLSNGFIVKKLAESYPIIKEIYENGNYYVHPSHVTHYEAVKITEENIELLTFKEYQNTYELKSTSYKQMLASNNALAYALYQYIKEKRAIKKEPTA